MSEMNHAGPRSEYYGEPKQIAPRDLQLRDVVRVGEMIWPCVVKKIDDKMVHLFRPYVHADDTNFGNSVITYIGIEEFPLIREGYSRVFLLERHPIQEES